MHNYASQFSKLFRSIFLFSKYGYYSAECVFFFDLGNKNIFPDNKQHQIHPACSQSNIQISNSLTKMSPVPYIRVGSYICTLFLASHIFRICSDIDFCIIPCFLRNNFKNIFFYTHVSRSQSRQPLKNLLMTWLIITSGDVIYPIGESERRTKYFISQFSR